MEVTRSKDQRIPRLAIIADLVHQARMAELAQSSAVVALAKARLAALEPVPVDPSDPSLIHAQLRHQQWAAFHRKRLEAEIAIGEATRAQRRAEAAKSLARKDAVDRIRRTKGRDQPS